MNQGEIAKRPSIECRTMDVFEGLKAREEQLSKELYDIQAAIKLMEDNPQVREVLVALSRVRAIF